MTCYWCSREIFTHVAPTHPRKATNDHIRSKPECISKAEYNHRDNQVPACYECNQRRSLEWCARRDAGLVHPTEWSLRQAAKEKRRQERRKQEQEEREFLKRCLPCPVVRVNVAPELNEAWTCTPTT